MVVEEVTFRRISVHVQHDAKRLDHGEDLNDALLDFFVKLGQALIPCGGLEGGFHSVAFLGSLFYNALTSRGVVDGRQGHANVANWARRRLGQGGLFFDGIGALAVPVNEFLGNQGKEKHWWLALLLNPRAGGRKGRDNAENMSLICLDSYAGADLKCNPPVRVFRTQCAGIYPLEVHGLTRKGVFAAVKFKSRGDGTAGPLADPKRSILRVHGREYTNPRADYAVDNRGDEGRAGQCEGSIEFALDSSVRIAGEYEIEFGGRGEFGKLPSFQLRRGASKHQEHVASFLAGYASKEWENVDIEEAQRQAAYDSSEIVSNVCLPDVPQQETDHDCGFFILEQILLSLQLSPELFRMLAKTSSAMISAMPWPSQKDVLRRKALLRESLNAIFKAAEETGNTDVEVLLKEDPELRALVKSSLWDGPRFCDAARSLVSHTAPKQNFSIADLGAMSTKELRGLCTQHGVLPPGTVERPDLLRALIPIVVKMAPPKAEETKSAAVPELSPEAQSSPVASPTPTEDDTPKADSSGPQATHLSTLRFTVDDLDKLPLKILRGLCIQHGVMPPCAMERDDFKRALIPVAARMEGSDSGPATEPARIPEPSSQGLKRPAPEHLSTLRFTLGDLAGMPLKTLRGLCVQHKVLPSCAVEREDFVKALTPLASDSQQGSSEATSGTDSSERQAKFQRVASTVEQSSGPQFSEEDLAAMPLKALKSFCAQYKVMPSCAVERGDFVRALLPFAVATACKGEGAVKSTNGCTSPPTEQAA